MIIDPEELEKKREYAKSDECVRIERQRMGLFRALSEEAQGLIVANGSLMIMTGGFSPSVSHIEAEVNEEVYKYHKHCESMVSEHMEDKK